VSTSDSSRAGGVAFASACHCSKSRVRKTRPEAVLANSVSPSGEYHTRSTGPVPADGKAPSIAEFPMCLQGVAWAHRAAETQRGKIAKRTQPTTRNVTLRHIK